MLIAVVVVAAAAAEMSAVSLFLGLWWLWYYCYWGVVDVVNFHGDQRFCHERVGVGKG